MLAAALAVLSSSLPPLRPPHTSPEAEAGVLSRATFSWLAPTLRLGRQRPLEKQDLPPLQWEDRARSSTDRFDTDWRALVATGDALSLIHI